MDQPIKALQPLQLEAFSLATSAMLVELTISCPTFRKLDRTVSEEIDAVKGTNGRAGNYNKDLLGNAQSLIAVQKYAANTRLWNNERTLSWSDRGPRLVPMGIFIDYKRELDERKTAFNTLKQNFVAEYPTLVSAQPFRLQSMYNSADYPPVEEVEHKFGFKYAFSPVPTSGDFRVDIAEAARRELAESYDRHCNDKIKSVMKEVWDKLHGCLTHMSERLTANEDGTRKTFHGTMVTNAQGLVDLLTHLNITKDPDLEAARRALAATLLRTDTDTLKESEEARAHTKAEVDKILSKFNW